MNALLLINVIILGLTGMMFGVWGSNPQSRVMGIVFLTIGVANAAVLFGVVAV